MVFWVKQSQKVSLLVFTCTLYRQTFMPQNMHIIACFAQLLLWLHVLLLL